MIGAKPLVRCDEHTPAPIFRDCSRLLVHTEHMVKRFSRYHKYTVGTELRQGAMQLMRTVNQAVHDKSRQTQHVQALVWRLDEYKLTLQLGMDIGAFAQSVKGSEGKPSPSFQAFEQAVIGPAPGMATSTTTTATTTTMCGWFVPVSGVSGAAASH